MSKRKISPTISEIRAILIGWVRYEGLYCVAAENLKSVTFTGTNNGAMSARIFGVKTKSTTYVSPPDCKYKIEELYKITSVKHKSPLKFKLQLVYMITEPDTLAYFVRPILSNPVVVTMLPDKNKIAVNLYTARTLFSGLHLKRMNKKIAKLLPDNCAETVEDHKMKKKDEKNEEKN